MTEQARELYELRKDRTIDALKDRIEKLEEENNNLICRLEEQTSYATMLRNKEDSIKDGYELKIAKLDKFVEAFGLLTTLSPKMEIDINHPLEMAQRIEREVTADRQRIAELETALQYERNFPSHGVERRRIV